MMADRFTSVARRVGVVAASVLMTLGAVTSNANAVSTPDKSLSGTQSTIRRNGSSTDEPLVAGAVIQTVDGQKVKLPKNWSSLTSNDLDALGIRPGQVSAAARKLNITEASITGSQTMLGLLTQAKGSSSILRPASADGCNAKVCIYVQGSGLKVENWGTRAVAGRGQVIYPIWWTPYNTVFLTGKAVTVPYDAAPESAGVSLGYNFPNNAQLCNTWSGVSGKPCITVHS